MDLYNNMYGLNYNEEKPAKIKNRSTDWRNNCKTLLAKTGYLLDNNLNADIEFVCEAIKLKSHKFMLSMASAVFEAMFRHEPNLKQVQIVDIHPETFQHMLTYIYKDIIPMGENQIISLLYAANKYAIYSLEMLCKEALLAGINSHNAGQLLMLGIKFGFLDLRIAALDHIELTTYEVFNDPSFIEIDFGALEIILSSDYLQISEIDLYNRVIDWCHYKLIDSDVDSPNIKRQTLGKCVYLVRYPLMTAEEFAKGPVEEGILTDEESSNIFKFIVTKRHSILLPAFNSSRRDF